MKDTIEYSIFFVDSDKEFSLEKLSSVQRFLAKTEKTVLAGFTWQNERFSLQTAYRHGFHCLRGSTTYDESITDEWLCVYILYLISQDFPEAWIEAIDDDGQFLLIEAAAALPEWLEPDVADARVWIHQGGIFIIEPKSVQRNAVKKLHPHEALSILHNGSDQHNKLGRNLRVEEQAFFRLRSYPRQIRDSLHKAAVTFSRKLATFVIHCPDAVSKAVRIMSSTGSSASDLHEVKLPELSELTFPPEDLVTIHWTFTRINFAQLKSAPRGPSNPWPRSKAMSVPGLTESSLDLGMKISTGFELLISQSNGSAELTSQTGMQPLFASILKDLERGTLPLATNDAISEHQQNVDDEGWLEVDYEVFENALAEDEELQCPKSIDDAILHSNLRHLKSKMQDIADDSSKNAWYSSDDEAYDSNDDFPDELRSDSVNLDDDQERERLEAENKFSEMMKQLMGMPNHVFDEIMQRDVKEQSVDGTASRPQSPESDVKNNAEEELVQLAALMKVHLFHNQ